MARLIWEVQDGWQYDDSNKTDLPIATTTLVNAQQDYGGLTSCQKIERVEVKDSAGNYVKLTQMDTSDIGGTMAMTEYLEVAGFPLYYDLIGDSIFLYPPPASGDVTLVAGLKIFFSRTPTLFTSASTTGVPGFASPFHKILPLTAAIDFEQDNARVAKWIRQRDELIKGLKAFYSSRNVERKPKLRPSQQKLWMQYL